MGDVDISTQELSELARLVVEMMKKGGDTSSTLAPQPVFLPSETVPEAPEGKKKKKNKKKTAPGVESSDPTSAVPSESAAAVPAGAGGGKFGGWDVPPPSQNDKNWCKTWMSDQNDDGSCFALMYHHCVDGVKDQSKIPPAIRAVKESALNQIYGVQKNCTHDSDKKVPKYKCFSKGPPKDWTSLCVARPDLAGKGKCSKVTPDEWRTWVQGEDPNRTSDCFYSSLYLKSHFRGAKILADKTGKHGRG